MTFRFGARFFLPVLRGAIRSNMRKHVSIVVDAMNVSDFATGHKNEDVGMKT